MCRALLNVDSSILISISDSCDLFGHSVSIDVDAMFFIP
jgi:hypothetical protein